MKIKCLLIMPGKEVQRIKIPANIKFIKSLLGENLQKIIINKNTIILLSTMPNHTEYNRLFKDYILIGTFLIISIKNRKIISMKEKEMKHYINMFKLSKHRNKVNYLKEEFLEEYYSNQKKIKKENRQYTKDFILKNAA